MEDKKYNELVNKWGKYGAIRSGLSFDTAIDFMFKIMDADDLKALTQASSSAISRMKNGKGSLKLDALQKVYQFYQDVSSMPVKDMTVNDSDLVALYNKKEVRDLLDDLRNFKVQQEATLSTLYRKIQTSLRSVRDQTSSKKIDPNTLHNFSKTAQTNEEATTKQKNKKTIPFIKEVKNEEEEVYLTNDYKEFYLKPQCYSISTMKDIMGYKGNYRKDFDLLTLRERYLLEFATLIKNASIEAEDAELAENVHQPSAFWKLHAKYGEADNELLRQSFHGRKIPQKKHPEYSNVADVKAWTNFIENWLSENKDFKDNNNNHSAKKNHIHLK